MKHWAIFLVLIGLSIGVYLNTLSGEMVYDDIFFSLRQSIRTVGGIASLWVRPMSNEYPFIPLYRPLTYTTFGLNYLFFGEGVWSFHLVNIFLHAGVTCAVYALLNLLFRKPLFSFFAASIFAILPVHVEAVAYTKARDELLSALFACLSWIAFVQMSHTTKERTWWYASRSALWYGASLVSKELLFFAPAIYFLFAYLRKDLKRNHWIAAISMFALVICLYIGIRMAVFGGTSALSTSDKTPFHLNPLQTASYPIQLMTAFRLVTLTVEKLYVPIRLSASYHYNHFPLTVTNTSIVECMIGIGIVLINGGLIVWKKTRKTPLGLSALIFIVSSVITAKFIFPKIGELFVERWLYFPSLAAALLLGYGAYMVTKRSVQIGTMLVIVVIVAFSVRTFGRNTVWATDESLYKSMTIDAPMSVQGHKALASIYAKHHDPQKALPYGLKAYDIYKDDSQVLNVLGAIAALEKRYDDAQHYLEEALRLNNKDLLAHVNYVMIFVRQHRWDDVVAVVQPYMEKNYGMSEVVVYWYAVARMMKEEYAQSLDILTKYKLIQKSDVMIRYLVALNEYGLSAEKETEIFAKLNVSPEEALEKIMENTMSQ